jgi:glycosyltransferase involved in cell wall biosynthesis
MRSGKRKFIRFFLRTLMAGYGATRSVFLRVGPAKRAIPAADIDILVTGTFYSDNWIITHLLPMAQSSRCRRVRMVASTPVPSMEKVEAIYPPAWLRRSIGGVPARLLIFIWLGLRDRPHVVGGFHLLLNGLVAGLLGRAIGARTLYICGGGPREVLGGGYLTENKLFHKIGYPDAAIERYLLAAVRDFDIVITMGNSAVRFFKQWDTVNRYYIVPGGFDGDLFSPANTEPSADIILVGRLSAVKRVDTFLRAIALTKVQRPGVTAIVVGDGPDRQALEALAAELGISNNVNFAGWQSNVEHWLRQARIFTLTSDFEGLSQAMVQAMLCGLPVVVSDVGDSSDLAVNGINGYLVKDRQPENFAACYEHILSDPVRRQGMSKSSRQISERHEVRNVSRAWDEILGGVTPAGLAAKHGSWQRPDSNGQDLPE